MRALTSLFYCILRITYCTAISAVDSQVLHDPADTVSTVVAGLEDSLEKDTKYNKVQIVLKITHIKTPLEDTSSPEVPYQDTGSDERGSH